PAAHKGKAKEAREQLTSNLVGEDGQLDPEVPYALGLDVLNTEISRGVAYDEFYGLMPEDVGEYDALANEILDRRSRTS
ncbi:partitioning protein parA, partial [Nocardia puris]|nr:partitioning protein parA [Nocardia puris]